jgi:hypothetical protein
LLLHHLRVLLLLLCHLRVHLLHSLLLLHALLLHHLLLLLHRRVTLLWVLLRGELGHPLLKLSSLRWHSRRTCWSHLRSAWHWRSLNMHHSLRSHRLWLLLRWLLLRCLWL